MILRCQPRASAQLRQLGHSERGSTTLETAIMMIGVLAIFVVATQAMLWYQAAELALASGDRAARVAGAMDGSAAMGTAAGQDFVRLNGHGALLDSAVSVQRDSTKVTVHVTGRAQTILPGFDPKIDRVVSHPVERFTK